MAKRFPQFHGVQQVDKRPKLSIIVNSSGLDPHQPKPGRSTEHHHDGPKNNIWDDDDDDVILLASQAFEAIEKHSQQIIVEQHSMNLDMTFTKFCGEGIKTSTQITNPNPIDSQFDDDDGLFCNIDEYRVEDDQQSRKRKSENQQSTDNGAFKIPKTTRTTIQQIKKSNDNCLLLQPTNHKVKETINTTKRNDSKDIQLKYMTSRLDALRKENEKFMKDISEFNNKLQTKDGEVSTLRYEIRNLKQINDKLRLEKMNKNVEKEWQEKIHELEKLLAAQQTELQFKSGEIQKLRSKQLNTSQLMYDTSIAHVEAQKTGTTRDLSSSLCNLHLSIDGDLKEIHLRTIQDIPSEIFENRKLKKFSLNFRENLFHQEFSILQNILAQVQNSKYLNRSEVHKFRIQILESLRKCMPEFQEYIRDLQYLRYRDTSALVEYKFLCQQVSESASTTNKTVFKDELLFPGEKGYSFRRYISALALLGECMRPIVSEIISKEKLGEYSFLQILTEIIEMIGFSKELFHHFGLIESFGYLLKSLVKTKITEYDTANLIKQLIFCRPNIRPLVQISDCLNIISQNDTNANILNLLCSKDNKGTFLVNDYYKILQFSPDSCPLQVYGCLLEVAFEQNVILAQQRINLLTMICFNHIRFIRNCIDRKIHWILEQSGSDDGDDDQQQACDCYTRISTSFIILFHLILKHWINDANCVDFRKISKISRLGALLLCNICKLNFRREILQIGGSIVKNRIKIIYDWLTEHKNLLQFKSAHSNALEFIKTSHVMADPLQNFEEISNQNESTEGDNVWSKSIFDEFF